MTQIGMAVGIPCNILKLAEKSKAVFQKNYGNRTKKASTV
jgi:hypothetical protein